MRGSTGLQPFSRESSTVVGQTTLSTFDDWDITGFIGADLLSDTVRTPSLRCCTSQRHMVIFYNPKFK